jgi:hypothetical protein
MADEIDKQGLELENMGGERNETWRSERHDIDFLLI